MANRKKSSSTKAKKPKTPGSKWITRLWLLFASFLVLISATIVLTSFQDLPSFEDLENPRFELASTVYADDGRELGRYYIENRVVVAYEDLNPHLISALISTEDERYFSHSGIDFKALMRVGVRTVILQQRSAGGGSTISQQLAKLLFPRERNAGGKIGRAIKLINTKLKEWITAVRLEKGYTKEEILAMYLNEFDFINGAHGIHSASETYFGKKQDKLNIQEAAMLIGMLKNPSLYNPRRFPEVAQSRRNVVLRQMEKADLIETVLYDSLSLEAVDMSRFKRSTHIDGVAPYTRAEIAKDLKKIFARKEYYKADGTSYNIYRDGLKVFTTLDYDMQSLAEKKMTEHMSNIQNRFFTEWKGRDPWTYNDETIPVSVKKEALESLIASSDRYQKLKTKLIGDKIRAIEEKFKIQLRDVDIQRMRTADKKRGTITRLLAQRMISSDMADSYRKVLGSSEWATLSESWNSFQEEVDKEFSKKVPMTVFAYNAKGEVDTLMSPLDSIKYHRMHLQTGIVALDPRNGHVKVWIGGISHKYYQYDHVRTDRQVGSTFKPFVYSSAIFFKGISPCYKVDDVPYTIIPGEGNFNLIKEWTPKNAKDEYDRTKIPLYDCLKKSKNTASVYLMKQLGATDPVRGLVHNMGLDSSIVRHDGEYRIPRQPSICLGSADLTVLEMAGAYSTFANNGVYNEPVLIERVEDKHGKVIYQSIPKEQIALDPKANFVMVDMLKYAGHGSPAFHGVESDFGGKTGTTNDHTDGWYMGITPSLVVGVWVGGEDRWIRFRNFTTGQGSRMARPFFSSFLKELETSEIIDYDKTLRFRRPAGDLDIEIDCEKYQQFEKIGDEQDGEQDFFEEDFGEEI